MRRRTNDAVDRRRSMVIAVLASLMFLAAMRGVGSISHLRADPPDDQNSQPKAVAPAGRSMQVTVLGPDGKSLAGAKVHAAIWAKEPAKSNQDFVCDQQGRVTVDLPNKVDILRLWARHEGHVSLFANWWPEREPQPREIPKKFTFRLERGTVIGGVVKNEDGQPIAGVKVAVMLVNPRGEKGLERQAIPNIWLAELDDRRITDAEGRWTLNNAPAGDQYGFNLMLEHPDYISDYSWGGLQSKQDVGPESLRNQTATIVMPRGARVTGVARDADGKAITDGIVIWGNDPYGEQGRQEVRLDEKGHYQFPPLPVGPLNVTIVAPGWAPDQQRVDLTAKGATADFQLKPGKRLRITFMDNAMVPIPGVSVGITAWRGGKALYNHQHPNVLDTKIPVAADMKGVYEWTWAPSDEVVFSFYKDGYRDNQQATLTAGDDETEYEFTLQR